MALRILQFIIEVWELGTTCERCPIKDCAERAAPPTVVEAKERRKRVQKVLRELGERG